MFSKLAIIAAASMAVFVAAVPAAREIKNSCNTGPVQCCQSTHEANSAQSALLQGILPIDLGSVTGQIGLNCSPLDVIGLGGNSCSSQPVCCDNNDYNGLVAVGCSPINLNA